MICHNWPDRKLVAMDSPSWLLTPATATIRVTNRAAALILLPRHWKPHCQAQLSLTRATAHSLCARSPFRDAQQLFISPETFRKFKPKYEQSLPSLMLYMTLAGPRGFIFILTCSNFHSEENFIYLSKSLGAKGPFKECKSLTCELSVPLVRPTHIEPGGPTCSSFNHGLPEFTESDSNNHFHQMHWSWKWPYFEFWVCVLHNTTISMFALTKEIPIKEAMSGISNEGFIFEDTRKYKTSQATDRINNFIAQQPLETKVFQPMVASRPLSKTNDERSSGQHKVSYDQQENLQVVDVLDRNYRSKYVANRIPHDWVGIDLIH